MNVAQQKACVLLLDRAAGCIQIFANVLGRLGFNQGAIVAKNWVVDYQKFRAEVTDLCELCAAVIPADGGVRACGKCIAERQS